MTDTTARYIPTGEWVLTTNVFLTKAVRFHSRDAAKTTIDKLYDALSSSPPLWLSSLQTELEPPPYDADVNPEADREPCCLAVYWVVGITMNERMKVVNLCSGRTWWVKYVTGNRKMTESVLKEGRKNPK